MIHCLHPVHIGDIHPDFLFENHVEIAVTLLAYRIFCCWVDSAYSDNDLLFVVDVCYPTVLKNLDLDSVDNHIVRHPLVLDLDYHFSYIHSSHYSVAFPNNSDYHTGHPPDTGY